MFLRDRGQKASYQKAVRAILATPGEQMMLDRPRPIYQTEEDTENKSDSDDIWGGSMMLSYRIEMLSMVLSRVDKCSNADL